MVNPTSPRSIGSIVFWCFFPPDPWFLEIFSPRSSQVHPRLFRLSKHHPNTVHHHGRIARKPVELRTHRHSWWASVVRCDPLRSVVGLLSFGFWATAGEWIKLSCKYWELEILTNLNSWKLSANSWKLLMTSMTVDGSAECSTCCWRMKNNPRRHPPLWPAPREYILMGGFVDWRFWIFHPLSSEWWLNSYIPRPRPSNSWVFLIHVLICFHMFSWFLSIKKPVLGKQNPKRSSRWKCWNVHLAVAMYRNQHL